MEVAKACEEAGAAAIAVHGRTRDQMYMGRADWDIIRQVKQAVQVPVIGNGDVVDAQSACQLLDATGCDMVLVGRGAMGNPWVFRQINAYLRDSCTILPPPGIAERIVVIRRHMDALCGGRPSSAAAPGSSPRWRIWTACWGMCTPPPSRSGILWKRSALYETLSVRRQQHFKPGLLRH